MLLPIIIPNQKLNRSDLEQFKNNPFENVIKFVVDVNQQLIAIGGEMHADAEKVLIENGSNQEDLWGANLWPWSDELKIEYISLINIRPHANNFGMEVESEAIRDQIKAIVFKWIAL